MSNPGASNRESEEVTELVVREPEVIVFKKVISEGANEGPRQSLGEDNTQGESQVRESLSSTFWLGCWWSYMEPPLYFLCMRILYRSSEWGLEQ